MCAQKERQGEREEERKKERCRTWIKLDQIDRSEYKKRWRKCEKTKNCVENVKKRGRKGRGQHPA